jgi:hypothetical protein
MRLLALAVLLAVLTSPSWCAVGGTGGGVPGRGNGGNSMTLAQKLAGTVWDIAITQGPKSQAARLTFREKELTCDWLQGMGISAIPYTASAAKGGGTSITGTYSDPSGGKLVITAKIQKDAISGGSIQVTTKSGETKTFEFSGGVPGSVGAKAAKAATDK